MSLEKDLEEGRERGIGGGRMQQSIYLPVTLSHI
jgi:hypothetical protein